MMFCVHRLCFVWTTLDLETMFWSDAIFSKIFSQFKILFLCVSSIFLPVWIQWNFWNWTKRVIHICQVFQMSVLLANLWDICFPNNWKQAVSQIFSVLKLHALWHGWAIMCPRATRDPPQHFQWPPWAFRKNLQIWNCLQHFAVNDSAEARYSKERMSDTADIINRCVMWWRNQTGEKLVTQ